MKGFFITIVAAALIMSLPGCGSSGTPERDTDDDVLTDVNYPPLDAADDGVDSIERDSLSNDATNPDDAVSDQGGQEITDDLVTIDTETTDTNDPDSTDPTDARDDTDVPPASGWKMMSVTIEDEIVNGDYVMNPVDGQSFGYNPSTREFVTHFTHDWEDPSISYIWHLDESTGKHTRKVLTGDPFPDGTNFCMDENWCQFIGFDANDSTWVVMGPRTPGIMKVNSSWEAVQVPLQEDEADQPPNGGISYSHLFTGDAFWVYGWITGSGFSQTLLKFNLNTLDWVTVRTGLQPLFTNCLTMYRQADLLYSVGGLTTDDGGNTSYAYGKVQVFNLASEETTTFDLPPELAGREGMACTIDEATGWLFVLGGSIINDNWDERLNEYHNDLWMWNGTDWTQMLADGEIGTFAQYGESWGLVADPSLPNFGRTIGKMIHDASGEPRLLVMGEVPGNATQIYTLALSDLVF